MLSHLAHDRTRSPRLYFPLWLSLWPPRSEFCPDHLSMIINSRTYCTELKSRKLHAHFVHTRPERVPKICMGTLACAWTADDRLLKLRTAFLLSLSPHANIANIYPSDRSHLRNHMSRWNFRLSTRQDPLSVPLINSSVIACSRALEPLCESKLWSHWRFQLVQTAVLMVMTYARFSNWRSVCSCLGKVRPDSQKKGIKGQIILR